jgi:hypothetical protein
MGPKNFKLLNNTTSDYFVLNDNHNNEENRGYLTRVINLIKTWRHDQYDEPQILYPQFPNDVKVNISFRYNEITDPNDPEAISIFYDFEDTYRELKFSFDEFKTILMVMISATYHDSLNLRIRGCNIEYHDERLLMGDPLNTITIPRESFGSILFVWGQIFEFDLNYHMTDPFDDREDI